MVPPVRACTGSYRDRLCRHSYQDRLSAANSQGRQLTNSQTNPATSPDRAAGDNLTYAVPCSSHGKRGCGKATTGERRRVAKVAPPRLPRVEETKTQEEEETPETPTANVGEGDAQERKTRVGTHYGEYCQASFEP
jgi:hypothetical protein